MVGVLGDRLFILLIHVLLLLHNDELLFEFAHLGEVFVVIGLDHVLELVDDMGELLTLGHGVRLLQLLLVGGILLVPGGA